MTWARMYCSVNVFEPITTGAGPPRKRSGDEVREREHVECAEACECDAKQATAAAFEPDKGEAREPVEGEREQSAAATQPTRTAVKFRVCSPLKM